VPVPCPISLRRARCLVPAFLASAKTLPTAAAIFWFALAGGVPVEEGRACAWMSDSLHQFPQARALRGRHRRCAHSEAFDGRQLRVSRSSPGSGVKSVC